MTQEHIGYGGCRVEKVPAQRSLLPVMGGLSWSRHAEETPDRCQLAADLLGCTFEFVEGLEGFDLLVPIELNHSLELGQ